MTSSRLLGCLALIPLALVVAAFASPAEVKAGRSNSDAVAPRSAAAASHPSQARDASGGNPFIGVTPAASIYFLPLDAHAAALLSAAQPTLQKWLPASVQLRTFTAIPPRWINKARYGEWNGRTTANDLLAELKSAQGIRQVFVMAVTSHAIYDPGTPQYAFVFGLLWWHKPQFAALFGTQPMRAFQPQREQARLTKMMLRYVGEIVCNQPRNNDPHSVLYQTILGTPDLDRMTATLPSICRR